jgi:hypothetical protein
MSYEAVIVRCREVVAPSLCPYSQLRDSTALLPWGNTVYLNFSPGKEVMLIWHPARKFMHRSYSYFTIAMSSPLQLYHHRSSSGQSNPPSPDPPLHSALGRDSRYTPKVSNSATICNSVNINLAFCAQSLDAIANHIKRQFVPFESKHIRPSPAMCGLAMLVPDKISVAVSLLIPRLTVSTPGARISASSPQLETSANVSSCPCHPLYKPSARMLERTYLRPENCSQQQRQIKKSLIDSRSNSFIRSSVGRAPSLRLATSFPMRLWSFASLTAHWLPSSTFSVDLDLVESRALSVVFFATP